MVWEGELYAESLPQPATRDRAFLTVWTPCPQLLGEDVQNNFEKPGNVCNDSSLPLTRQTVRDMLESIDLILELIDHYPELSLARSAEEVEAAFKAGKLAALIGMEG